MKFCFLQVSDRLLNPDDKSNPADNYFKAIWPNMAGEGYYRPEHYWEIPTWIAELSHCLKDKDHELELYHIDKICPDDCPTPSQHAPILPDADIYFASVMDCNKEILKKVVRDNPKKFFYFGGYIGRKEFYSFFHYTGLETTLSNVSWCDTIQEVCDALQVEYQYGTDYLLFKGMKCIPRLTLSNGCTNRCRFCTIPDEIIETAPLKVLEQIKSFENLDFESVYISDKTFGQASNYDLLKYSYTTIKSFNPKFRGFTIQTTCYQILKFYGQGINLKDLGIVNVEIGVESYNDDILKKYNKPQNTGTIDMALNILKSMGINIIPNIIIGLPGESMFSYWNTLDWILRNKHDFLMLNVTNFVPYGGSDASGIVKTQPGDLNQTVCKRSYHTEKEAIAVEVFTELLFGIGMDILKATKAKTT